jgi:8-oxo-dGTP pyrophosphatase MutT (NUDIX family)
VLISPKNEVLMLHRVRTASAFPSAHAFAGGKISEEQDGPVPPPGDPRRHVDSKTYRLCAIRETFEESGVLLAKAPRTGRLFDLPDSTRKEMRKVVHKEEVKFTEWLKELGAEPELGMLTVWQC